MKKVASTSKWQKFVSQSLTQQEEAKIKGGDDIVTTDAIIL